MLRRHWWIIALSTAIGLLGALGIASTQPKVYDSTTYVLVMPTSTASTTVSGGRTTGTINLDTEAQLVTSAEVAADAAKLLKVTVPPSQLAAAVTVDVPANTSVMAITYEAATPGSAQAGSHAFATAYLTNRQTTAQADLSGQVKAISDTIKREQTSLVRVNDALSNTVPGSAKQRNEQTERQTLISQINTLTSKMTNLTTTTVTSGKIITDANLPSKPAKPSIPLFLSSGAMIGLLIGIALAIVRQRADRRIRSAADVPRRSGLPLLAALGARIKPKFDEVYPPYGAGGRTFNRLRNEILASLREDERTIVVTGASKGSGSTLVAANLASALARAGSEVVLISAHLPFSLTQAPLTRLLGVAATPGLSDVLAGKVPLDTATQRAPRNPWLRVITTGGTASASGFLQSQTLREILAQIKSQADYVVIEAPSTANSADAQTLAGFADAVIVTVELRRTTHAEVLDAADQLQRVTASLVGCVVLPPLKRDVAPEAPALGRALDLTPTGTPHVESLPTAPIRTSRDSGPIRSADETQVTEGATSLRLISSPEHGRVDRDRPAGSPAWPLNGETTDSAARTLDQRPAHEARWPMDNPARVPATDRDLDADAPATAPIVAAPTVAAIDDDSDGAFEGLDDMDEFDDMDDDDVNGHDALDVDVLDADDDEPDGKRDEERNGERDDAPAGEPVLPRQVGTAAEAALATSVASSEMADSFFSGEYDEDEPSASVRRRTIPGRLGFVREQSRRPAGTHDDDSPVEARVDGAWDEDADEPAADGEIVPSEDITVERITPTGAVPGSSAPNPLTPGAGTPGPAAPPKTPPGPGKPRTAPSVLLPETVLNQAPINPTNIVSPVVGGTSIVVKPSAASAGTGKGTGSAPNDRMSNGSTPHDSASNGTAPNGTASNGSRPNGSAAHGTTGIPSPNGGVSSNSAPNGAAPTPIPNGSVPNGAIPNRTVATVDGAPVKPRGSEEGRPRSGTVLGQGAFLAEAPVKAVGHKSVPGGAEPIAGGDTVVFKRIDLVYVEDGDGDGASR